MKKILLAPLLGLFVMVSSCQSEKDQSPAPTKSATYSFETDTEGWTTGFADYPEATKSIYELEAAHSPVPANLSPVTKSIKIGGTNRSDDLFMFLKKEFTGLEPNKTYRLTFNITLASKYPVNSFGVGGSPGASVYLKAGASLVEPKPVLNADGFWRMNIDKGEQATSGKDMQVLGPIGIPGDEFVYQRITRTNADTPMQIKTNETGKIWLAVGTDSGFESNTTLYYDEIQVKFQPVE